MILSKHTYFGVKTVYFDNVDLDLLSTIELKYMMEEVRYTNAKKYPYTKPGEEPQHGLHPLVSDSDMMDMVKLIPGSREMTIYVEHDVNTPHIAPASPQDQTSNYFNVFDEITDDAFSQVLVELFSQATYSQHDEVNNEEWVGVNDNIIAGEEGHGLYETFVQESEECTNGFHYEHGTDSDNSDYELYDSENDADAAIERIDAPQGVYIDKRWAYPRLEIDQVMNHHTTVVHADVRDVVHAIDGVPMMSRFYMRYFGCGETTPSKGLYCDPHEATKVQDTSQPTLTRGLEARVLRLDGLLMNPPTTSKQTFAPWKSPGKTFVNKNQNSSLKKT
ncbi:unnamed protein product [Malus baccata var. baccata]